MISAAVAIWPTLPCSRGRLAGVGGLSSAKAPRPRSRPPVRARPALHQLPRNALTDLVEIELLGRKPREGRAQDRRRIGRRPRRDRLPYRQNHARAGRQHLTGRRIVAAASSDPSKQIKTIVGRRSSSTSQPGCIVIARLARVTAVSKLSVLGRSQPAQNRSSWLSGASSLALR